MPDLLANEPSHLDWGVAGRPRPGEPASGDMAVAQAVAGRYVLAVIDGLGHGPAAAAAAALAAEAVRDNLDRPPDALLAQVHRRLAGSRGAAVTVAVVDRVRGQLDWLGVGNVNGVLVRADGAARPGVHGVFLGGGVLGAQMPSLPPSQPLRLEHGDCLVIATDGVRADLAEVGRSALRPDALARKALADHALPTDDAVVLVARYLGRRDVPAGAAGARSVG